MELPTVPSFEQLLSSPINLYGTCGLKDLFQPDPSTHPAPHENGAPPILTAVPACNSRILTTFS